jgi:hypothetical protein
MATNGPLAYFITFSCYGTHLHGDPVGSVLHSNGHGGPFQIDHDSAIQERARRIMRDLPYSLDPERRRLVLKALFGTVERGWYLACAQVRGTHVHVVVRADNTSPEVVLTAMKAMASKVLNASGLDPAGRRRWTRHGSTRYLWNERALRDTIAYVVDGQGEQMEVFVNAGVLPMP